MMENNSKWDEVNLSYVDIVCDYFRVCILHLFLSSTKMTIGAEYMGLFFMFYAE